MYLLQKNQVKGWRTCWICTQGANLNSKISNEKEKIGLLFFSLWSHEIIVTPAFMSKQDSPTGAGRDQTATIDSFHSGWICWLFSPLIHWLFVLQTKRESAAKQSHQSSAEDSAGFYSSGCVGVGQLQETIRQISGNHHPPQTFHPLSCTHTQTKQTHTGT